MHPKHNADMGSLPSSQRDPTAHAAEASSSLSAIFDDENALAAFASSLGRPRKDGGGFADKGGQQTEWRHAPALSR